MPTYTNQNLRDQIWDPLMDTDIASILTINDILSYSVREVIKDLDLRSTKRRTTISPNLFDDIYDYTCPTDLKGQAIIDLIPQINRTRDSELILTTPEEFDRKKTFRKNLVAFNDHDFVRKLRASLIIDDDQLLVSELDSLTSGGGTWAGYGDGTNLTADHDNYVKGNGSINWDISAVGGTTAGIYNNDLDDFDLTDYVSAGCIFVWAYITSTTNLTNFIIRIGSSSTVYYTKTITTTNEGTAFVAGWNLLRFDFSSATQVGTVDLDACNYVALFMTKAAGKISETDYRFDWLVIKRGKIYDVAYYSKYGWQTSAGTYQENSTATTDLLNADTDEVDLIVKRARMEAARRERDWDTYKVEQADYIASAKDYRIKNPSEAKLLTQIPYDFPSQENERIIPSDKQ